MTIATCPNCGYAPTPGICTKCGHPYIPMEIDWLHIEPATMKVRVNGVERERRIVEYRTELGELRFRFPLPVPEVLDDEILYWIANGSCFIVSGKR